MAVGTPEERAKRYEERAKEIESRRKGIQQEMKVEDGKIGPLGFAIVAILVVLFIWLLEPRLPHLFHEAYLHGYKVTDRNLKGVTCDPVS